MLTILEYLWVRNPEVILELVKMNALSDRVFITFPKKKTEVENAETYAHLMKHDRWRRVRGGAIRQVHSCEK